MPETWAQDVCIQFLTFWFWYLPLCAVAVVFLSRSKSRNTPHESVVGPLRQLWLRFFGLRFFGLLASLGLYFMSYFQRFEPVQKPGDDVITRLLRCALSEATLLVGCSMPLIIHLRLTGLFWVASAASRSLGAGVGRMAGTTTGREPRPLVGSDDLPFGEWRREVYCELMAERESRP